MKKRLRKMKKKRSNEDLQKTSEMKTILMKMMKKIYRYMVR